MSNKVYEIVTDKIIAALEKGVVPWKQPWKSCSSPVNGFSGRAYRGINTLLLHTSALERGFSSNRWYTYSQVAKKSGKILPQESKEYCVVVYWNWVEKKENEENEDQNKQRVVNYPLLRYYRVYNHEQTTLPEEPQLPQKEGNQIRWSDVNLACSEMLVGYKDKPYIQQVESSAWYNPEKDLVNIPKKKLFSNPQSFFSVMAHELVHSTGHINRLGRQAVMETANFGSDDYGKEELAAEIGSCFLCSNADIGEMNLENSASYIQSWLEVLRNDKRMIVIAAAQAQKAADYILGINEKQEEKLPLAA
jgi:antirestriction protein ArdC